MCLCHYNIRRRRRRKDGNGRVMKLILETVE
jgi:hypothetical protein